MFSLLLIFIASSVWAMAAQESSLQSLYSEKYFLQKSFPSSLNSILEKINYSLSIDDIRELLNRSR